MNHPSSVRLGPVALQILAYLSSHREAQDTVEGIAEWWLLEKRIRHDIPEVKQALAELAAHGLVLERRGRDGRIHYLLNPRKRRTFAQHLQAIPAGPTAVATRRANRIDR
jgi:DNA-binding MarR family transcriptional regulator